MTRDSIDALADPAALRERDDVPDTEVRRTLPDEAFDGLQEHYSSIDGVVQVGIRYRRLPLRSTDDCGGTGPSDRRG
jgi:hypothetical protein